MQKNPVHKNFQKKKRSKTERFVQAACTAIIAVGLSSTPMADEPENKMEKCYGIAKKGMNDCGANDHSCQGHSVKDGDTTEWIFVPAGTCEKIVNGSTKSSAIDSTKTSDKASSLKRKKAYSKQQEEGKNPKSTKALKS